LFGDGRLVRVLRRGRQLSCDDLTHYRRVVVALRRTMQLMDEIDTAIPAWPLA